MAQRWSLRDADSQQRTDLSASKVCQLILSPKEPYSSSSLVTEHPSPPAPSESVWRPVSEEPDLMTLLEKRKAAQNRPKKRKAERPTTSVFISGLPLDVSVEELVDHFRAAGSIKEDVESRAPYVEVYEPTGQHATARVTYEQPLAATIAVDVLHESLIRAGFPVLVAMGAGQWNGKRPRRDAGKRSVRRLLGAKLHKEKFSWLDEVSSGMRIVVVKGVFDPPLSAVESTRVEKEVGLACQRIGGPLEKLTVFGEHPEGVVAVKFGASVGADRCIQELNGALLCQRRVHCAYFDGTDYRKRTQEEDAERIDAFGKWIEEQ